ncbi:MAG: DUF177 domain-containing protein [Candidatus Dadabacteria bacterium]|nr:DUF177 domain-containing protein [Candidatus Dadabacteria bacterium]NIS09820.1 DUF177 domain-containing protein [Candidatus Dadabacteria bacterium]NIY22879.1 hypothetical protein [Candidatus Dadabacteria bacterium]
MNKIQFDINEIGENGLHFKSEQPPAFLSDIGDSLNSIENIVFDSNVRIDANIYKDERQIVLNGSLNLSYISPCSRCLIDVALKLNSDLKLILVPDSKDEDEYENDTVVSSYSGNTIDITDYLTEMVSISLPVKILCDEACKGLCPDCGADLNTDICSCKQDRVSPEFAVLKNYKN